MVLTYGIPPEFRGSVHLGNRHTPLGQSRVYRVAQLRTNGVHCRDLAGTGPVVLNVVPVTGAVISGITTEQILYVSLFSHLLLVQYVIRTVYILY